MEAVTLMMEGNDLLHGQERGSAGCITATSGERCPAGGEWEIVGSVTTTTVLAKGDLMPEYYGRKILWMLIRKG